MAFPLRLIAHRGASKEYPENTLEAFQRALTLGVDALETDVHMTSDGQVVISHDDTGQRAALISTAIRRVTLAEVQSWDAGKTFTDRAGAHPFAGKGLHMPSLHQLLDLSGDTLLNIDIKQHTPNMVPTLLALLRDRGVEPRVTLASFHRRTLSQVHALGYRGPIALQQREVLALRGLPSVLARRCLVGTAVQIPPRAGPLSLSKRAFINKCHRLGRRVDYWTINAPAEAERLLQRGADGIMTDDPAAMQHLIARYRTRRVAG